MIHHSIQIIERHMLLTQGSASGLYPFHTPLFYKIELQMSSHTQNATASDYSTDNNPFLQDKHNFPNEAGKGREHYKQYIKSKT